MRLLTFQSSEVLDIILKEGIYYCDLSLSRERRDYREDVKQLGGFSPIWCFSPIGITVDSKPLKEKDKFSQEDFIDGILFQIFKQEMSILRNQGMNRFILLEIEVPSYLPKLGITNNAYRGAVVIPYLKKDYLAAVYSVRYKEGNILESYYPDVKILNRYKEDIIFKHDFSCRDLEE